MLVYENKKAKLKKNLILFKKTLYYNY